MYKIISKNIFSSLLFLSLFIWGVIAYILFVNDYFQFIHLIEKEFTEVYDIDKMDQFFTIQQFLFLKIWILGIILSHFVVFYLVRKYKYRLGIWKNKLADELTELSLHVYGQFKFSNKEEWILLLLIFTLIIANHIYVWLASPFRIDDIASYVFFAHNGPIASGLFYHDVNNHILFNIICSFFDKLFLPPELVMFLPSSFAWLIIMFLVFAFTRAEAGYRPACMALLLSGLLSFPANYSVQGRGYILMSLFLLISFFSVYLYFYKNKRSIYLALFVLFSFLATWTLISSLIAIIPLLIFLAIKINKSDKIKVLYVAITLFSLIAFVYIPVLLINGLNRLYNPYVSPKGFSYYLGILKPALLESIDCLLGVRSNGYLILAGLFLLLSFLYYKKRISMKWLTFLFIITMGSFLFITIRTSFPPYRTWTYISFLLSISVAIIFGAVIDLFSKKKLFFYSLSIFIISYCLFPYQNSNYIQETFYLEKITTQSKLFSANFYGTILVDRTEMPYHYMKLESIKRNNEFKVVTGRKENVVYDMVMQHGVSFPEGLKKEDYYFVDTFDDARVYKHK